MLPVEYSIGLKQEGTLQTMEPRPRAGAKTPKELKALGSLMDLLFLDKLSCYQIIFWTTNSY